MFQRHNKKKKTYLNSSGFSLVEILIAVGILLVIMVPLAMNMISSSQINSKAKQTAASSDLSAAILEVLQTVDLSDVLTDVNGYSTDEYGTKLPYTLTGSALKNYKIGSTSEMIKTVVNEKTNECKYVPVKKQEEVIQDSLVTSSIKIRDTGDATRAYFTGQENDEYSFLLRSVETDELNVDVLVTIKAEQTFDIVNIVSMAQSEVVYTKQALSTDQIAATEFARASSVYAALYGNNSKIEVKDADWFSKNMERTITVNIKQDTFSEATTITIDATYTVETDSLRDVDKSMTKSLGSFSTNSTAELARGIYVYYYPLENTSSTKARDHFVINNKNELSTPVYLIAMASDTVSDPTTLPNYTPTLDVYELSSEVHQTVARTSVCSNVDNGKWIKSLTPLRPSNALNVKTLGNTSRQQTLYSVTVQIFRHIEESFLGDGTFVPRNNDLLIETKGSFIDTSEKLDIDSDKTTGLIPNPGNATAGKHNLVYNEKEQIGVYGDGVNWTGITAATDAGTYTAYATPMTGNSWADGTTTTKTFTWTIERLNTASATAINSEYSAKMMDGVNGTHVTITGTSAAYDAGVYTAWVTPMSNYAWEDGTYQTRSIKWRIIPKEVTIVWGTTTWTYDGQIHYGTCEVQGILTGDKCTATIKNNAIKDVGVVKAYISALSNKNYSLPDDNTEKELKIISEKAANITLKNDGVLVYNGKTQSIVDSNQGVYFSGTTTAMSAGTYNFVANVRAGYTWEDGSTSPKSYSWTINPITVDIDWGTLTWTYDGQTHSTTCVVKSDYILDGDAVQVLLKDNAIRNVGTVKVIATGLSNTNYRLKSDTLEETLTIERAKLASYNVYNFDYDGHPHTGVTGQYIIKTGQVTATNVCTTNTGEIGSYIVEIEPMSNYAWEDGTYGAKKETWTIYPMKDADYEVSDMLYNGFQITGVFGTNTDYLKDSRYVITAKDVSKNGEYYVTSIMPIDNHAWKDGLLDQKGNAIGGTRQPIELSWRILAANYMKPTLETDVLVYNGKNQYPYFNAITMSSGYDIEYPKEAKNVGTYTMTLTLKDSGAMWADGTNAPIKLTWKIIPKTIPVNRVNIGNTEWMYNADERVVQAEIIQRLGNETVIYEGDICELVYENNTRTNAGEQEFKISGVTNKNYKLQSTITGTMKITPKVVGINWGTRTWTYDGTTKTVTPTPTGVYSGDSCSFTLSNNTRKNAGSQTVTINGVTNNNYTIPNNASLLSETMTINRAKIATVRGQNATFNGSAQPGVFGRYVTCSGDTWGTDAKTYTAYATPEDNYAWEDGTYGKKEVEWTIDRAKIATASKANKTYNTYEQIGVTGQYVTWTGTVRATNAGTYKAYATPDSNYAWEDGTYGEKEVEWTMNKRKTAAITYLYKEDYDGGKHNGCTYEGGIVFTGVTSATDAGEYTFTATPDKNHLWIRGGSETRTYTWHIKRLPLAEFYLDVDGATVTDYAHCSWVFGPDTVTATPDKNYAWADVTSNEYDGLSSTPRTWPRC